MFEVKQFSVPTMRGSEHHGKWFVILQCDPPCYLHTDGNLRGNTQHNGLWTGFFLTQESAEAALKSYLLKRIVDGGTGGDA